MTNPCDRRRRTHQALGRRFQPRLESLEPRLTLDASAAIDDLTPVGSTLYFVANDGTHGSQIWTSSGDQFSTAMLTDINPGSVGGQPQDLTVVGSQVFFTANDGTHGRELWVTTGPGEFSTFMVDDINPSGSSDPQDLVDFNGTLFFTADDGTHGRQLWESDGTETGTFMVQDINSDAGSNPQNLTVVGSTLYFTADDGTHGAELWSTTGSGVFTTALVKDINPGTAGSAPEDLTNFNGTLFFTADDGTDGRELWTSNGTSVGTTMVDDIDPAPGSDPADLTVFNNALYFSADDGTHGRQLWSSTGAGTGTQMVAANSGALDPDQLTVAGSSLYFSATDSTHGRELWVTSGTALGTNLVDDIEPGTGSSNPQFLTESNGSLFFAATSSNGTQLWKTAGTSATTIEVANVGTGATSLSPAQLTDVNGLLYFTANGGTDGRELWTSDGLTQDTAMVLDINTGSGTVNTAPILNVDQVPQMTTIFANWTNNPGTLVSTLLASSAEGQPIYDPDTGATQGIAVTGIEDTNGTWQYTTNGGTTWTAFGAVSQTSAVLLAANAETSVRFVPDVNFGGDVPGGITFVAWDQTTGTAGSTADTTTAGAATAFSSAYLSADLRVTPGGSHPWQNQVDPDDVNGDGSITPADALAIINELNSTGPRTLPVPATASDHPEPFYDVSGDNQVTPQDALDVINFLNSQAGSGIVAQASGTAAIAGVSAMPAAQPAATESTGVGATASPVDVAPVAFTVSTQAAPGGPAVPAAQNQTSSAAATDQVFAQYGSPAGDASPASATDAASLFSLAAHRTARAVPPTSEDA